MEKSTLLTIILSFIILSACKLPATGVPPATLLPEAAYTEAVMTIVAGYTQTAQSPMLANETATLSPTQTKAIPPTVTVGLEKTVTPIPPSSPTATLSATTPQSTAVQTLAASDPRFGLGEPIFKDNFENAQNWPIYSDEHVKILIEDGKLSMTAKKPDFFNSWVLTWPRPANFYLEATATMGTCGGRDRYGLIFRVPDVSVSQGYLYAFACNGMYSIWYWDGEKETDLIEWTASEFIQPGEGKTNRIGVRADGNQLALYANGILVTTLTDNRLDEGYFGTFIGSAQTEDYTATFDEIAYWDVK